MEGAIHVLGGEDRIAEALAGSLGRPVERGWPTDVAGTGLVVIPVFGPLDEVPGGNAFAACRALKDPPPGPAVFLVAREDDPWSAEIARFCLADGCLRWSAEHGLTELDALHERIAGHRSRVQVDKLLERLEKDLAGDEARQDAALRRLMRQEQDQNLLDLLTDGETGLFDGPFASFKLDEEFKRSMRFHHPLSLVLLDIGWDGAATAEPGQRAGVFADVASVFLNECRDIDVLARFTESTFLFLLPGTGRAGCQRLAERLAESLRAREFGPDGARLDPAAGMATVPQAGIPDRRSFVAVAEEGLRRARAGEGNGGVCASWE